MDAFTAPQALTSHTFVRPPLDGSLSLPQVCDFHAAHSPHHPLYVYHDGKSVCRIPWVQAARAIHTASRLIEDLVPQTQPGKRISTVIGILAMADTLTYHTLILAIIRAGYQAFPISSRNSPTSLAHLIQQTRCKHLFVGDDIAMQRLVSATCAQRSIGGTVGDNLHLIQMPTFEQLYTTTPDESAFMPLPPSPTPDLSDPALILHTSGSTSLPKPITITHRVLLQWGLLPYYGETDICGQILSTHSVPAAHGMGAIQIAFSAMCGVTLGCFSPNNYPAIPTPERVLSAAVETGCNLMVCMPSFLEVWARNPDSISALARFANVNVGGAPLEKEIGDMLVSKGVPLTASYGSTEIGCVSAFVTLPTEDWQWFRFSPQCRVQLIPRYDNVYHLVLLESPTHTLNMYNAQLGGTRAYDTQDLVVQHPTNPNLWQMYGRLEDQITHSNGLKTNPLPIETLVVKHPMVKTAIVFGRARNLPGILVEPEVDYIFDPADIELLAQYRKAIWPVIDQANQLSPSHSRIPKEMILVTSPYKTFDYTFKHTPHRLAILDTYDAEIDRLYAVFEAARPSQQRQELIPPSTWGQEQCLSFTRTAVETIIPFELGDDDDFFQAGCDSLQATWLRNTIYNALRRGPDKAALRSVPKNFVYFNPTIRKLAKFISNVMNYSHSCVGLSALSGQFQEMEDLVKKYSANFPSHQPSGFRPSNCGEVVLVTGTTGALGSHLLENLVKDPSVAKVYAINRTDSRGVRSVYIRQSASFRDRDLDFAILNSEKLMLLEGDAALDKLGLDDDDLYAEIVSSLTCIIHCAWTVNFNVSLCTLEPLIAGTRNLIDLALHSPQASPPRFLFTSSLSVFSNASYGSVAPESYNARPATAIGCGYSESKWVAESILAKAAERTSLQPSIIRLGQISGSRNGSWNPREWFPTLIRSAQVIHCLPQPPGLLSWIPIHDVAGAITEIVHTDRHFLFLNLTHPTPTQSSVIFETLAEILQVPLVKYIEWLVALEASMRTPDGRKALNIPALTLMDFYRSTFSETFGYTPAITASATQAAPSLVNILKQISRTDVEGWVRYWRKIGYLNPW